MATLFPPETNSLDGVELTWVYAVYVRRLYNSHARQVADGMSAIKNEMAIRKKISEESDKTPWGGAESGFHKNLGPQHIPDEPDANLVDL